MNITRAKKQRGIASFIIVLLVGLSLSVMTFGMASKINGAQDSITTVHSQAQAEIMAASGYQALASYFLNKTKLQLDSVTGGVISTAPSIRYVKNTTDCPISGVPAAPNYCFDVTATKSSGNVSIATSTVRALFQSIQTIKTSLSTSSVFGGGLTVAGNAVFTGDASNQITVELKGGAVNVIGGSTTINGVNFTDYIPRSFITAADLRGDANYIFYLDSSLPLALPTMCRNNMGGLVVESSCTKVLPSFVSYDYDSKEKKWMWNINAAVTPAGVLWFSGDAVLTLEDDTSDYTRRLSNTFLVTGNLRLDDSGANKIYSSYSASFFNTDVAFPVNISEANKKIKICSSSASNRPDQYCDSTGSLKDTAIFPAAIANILFLVDGVLDLNNSAGSTYNLYGNVISNSLKGGTGTASGDVKGNGKFNVIGNIIVSGNSLTTIQGSVNFDLSRANISQNAIPTISYTNILKNIKYQ
jgi:hypothetical protein